MTDRDLWEAMVAVLVKVQALQDQRNALLDPWVNGGPDLTPEQWEQVRVAEVELRPLRAELDHRMREMIGS